MSGIGKKLAALGKTKDCAVIESWRQSVVNHVYWCAASTPSGDSNLMATKWESIMYHIQNHHEDHDNPLFPKCAHEPLDEASREKHWITQRMDNLVLSNNHCKYLFDS